MSAAEDDIALPKAFCGKFAEPLDCVADEQYAVLRAKIANDLPGLDCAGFVVCRHENNGRGVVPHRLACQCSEIDDSVCRDGDEAETIRQVLSTGLQKARVLN